MFRLLIRKWNDRNNIKIGLNKFIYHERGLCSTKNKGHAKPTFEDLILQRQRQASKSILVQVPSSTTYARLLHYCQQFGSIEQCFYYSTHNNKDRFILFEFKNHSSVRELIDSSTHLQNEPSVPITSQFLAYNPNIKIKGVREVPSLTKQKNAPSKLDIYNDLQNCASVDEQIWKLYEMTSLTDLDIRLRFFGAHQIKSTLSGIFPNAKVYPFGSSVNGFGKIGSDLDLVMNLNGEFGTEEKSKTLFFLTKPAQEDRLQKRRYLEILCGIIGNVLPGISNVRPILHARVPIIKYHQQCLELEVDISINNLTGLYMSELFYLFGKIDNRVRPLTFCIRLWAKEVGLTYSITPGNWITNFSLTCLVIFFLQQLKKPILPSVSNLIQAARPEDYRITEDEINCTFLRNLSNFNLPKTNTTSIHELLLEFFKFYANFNFNQNVISILAGSSFHKPPQNQPMHIINPLEPELNVSKNVSVYECEQFSRKAREAAAYLELHLKRESKSAWGITNFINLKSELEQLAESANQHQNTSIRNIFNFNRNPYVSNDRTRQRQSTGRGQMQKTTEKNNGLDSFVKELEKRKRIK